jgi:hypothetical protein
MTFHLPHPCAQRFLTNDLAQSKAFHNIRLRQSTRKKGTIAEMKLVVSVVNLAVVVNILTNTTCDT